MEKLAKDFLKDYICVFYCHIPDNLSYQNCLSLISTLPKYEQNRILSITHLKSLQNTLLGRIILRYSLEKLDFMEPLLIETTITGKPYMQFLPFINFNISHSASMVVCAITKNSSIGIDIEKIRNIDLSICKQYFTIDEWDIIQKSTNPQVSFFCLWARKEALIKGNGRGMEIDLSSLNCLRSKVNLDMKTWHIQDIKISEDYACTVACEEDKIIKLFDFNKLCTIEALLNTNISR